MSRVVLEARGSRDPLATSEQAAFAEETLSTIRHDLRNRLATVRNAVYYIKRKLAGSELGANDPRILLFLEAIDKEMSDANSTVGEGRTETQLARAGSRQASGRLCVERGVTLSRVEVSGIQIDAELDDGDVAMDPDILAMAVRCLVENAAEAMPGGGVVTIHAAPNSSQFVIEVKNEGSVLPEGLSDGAFHPFNTNKPGHSGLGLAMASRAARRVGGRLTLRQEPSGVVATLSLPLLMRNVEEDTLR